MKSKMMKSISLLICFVLVLSTSMNIAFADNKSNTMNKISLNELSSEKIDCLVLEETMDILEKAGLVIDSEKVNSNGEVELIANEKTICSEITVKRAIDSEIKLLVTEGDKSNEIVIKDSGDLYIDGFLAGYDEYESVDYVVLDAVNYYATPPVYTTSDYYHNSGTTVTHNYQAGQKIMNLTVTALRILINSKTSGMGSAISDGILSNIITSATNGTDDYLKARGPVYYHTVKKTFMVSATQGCQREILSFYGKDGNRIMYSTRDVYKYMTQNGA